MKALVFKGPGQKELAECQMPEITQPTDAIVKMVKSTICGTDLHILKGDVPAVTPGRILGHEGVGIVEEIGSAVSNFKKGDKVLISCVTSCGKCDNCKKQLYAHCTDGGWILGHLIDGTQAEYVRIPHADNSLYHLKNDVDEEGAVMLSDILPTGFEIGVLNGKVNPGDTVAIIGAGPVGFAALLTAQFFAPAKIIMVDLDQQRLDLSKDFGATDLVNSSEGNVVENIKKIAGPEGVDVAIEAVGIPATFDICQKILKPGAHLANVGVHGKPVELHIEELWIRNVTITTGLVCTSTTPMLLKNVESKKLKPEKLVSHRFDFADMMKAYDVFGNAAREKAMKVIINFN
ncbi:zinc-dependent alcohol dehydrogenase family protein [Chryseobacterium sp. R2A-55]|uniref:zinc-dependent alcohol dehydrogenase family protein n=1 Tax=Chryseobacterium sp. R2A-55 TaxID=2744445 RepID=UPI001F248D74|nr:zinc-dependent alcohol dehydrogenase family protein [Chryseobacterium sp. R2A-55]